MLRKILLTNCLLMLGISAFAQNLMPRINLQEPKTFGSPIETTLTSENLKKAKIEPIPIAVEVRLVKPIVMGCQYIHRVTNKSSDKTLKLKMYTVPDTKFEEKIKPGESIELLTNTMSKCEGKKGEEGCLRCEPSLTITEVSAK